MYNIGVRASFATRRKTHTQFCIWKNGTVPALPFLLSAFGAMAVFRRLRGGCRGVESRIIWSAFA